MAGDTVVALIEALLPVSLVIAVVLIVWILRDPIKAAIPGIQHVKVAGVELQIAGKELLEKSGNEFKDPAFADELVQRASELRDRLADFRVLWVDDEPRNNLLERRFLRRAGATVVNALSTEDALIELRRDDFDVVVTDFRRGERVDAGPDLAARAFEEGHRQPVLAYVGRADPSRPAPQHIQLVTDHPDVLIARLLDIARDRSLHEWL